MYKRTLTVLLAVPIFGSELIAGTGSAYDAELFLVGIMVFLLTLAAILQGIDYIKKNGRKLVQSTFHYCREGIQSVLNLLKKFSDKTETIMRV